MPPNTDDNPSLDRMPRTPVEDSWENTQVSFCFSILGALFDVFCSVDPEQSQSRTDMSWQTFNRRYGSVSKVYVITFHCLPRLPLNVTSSGEYVEMVCTSNRESRPDLRDGILGICFIRSRIKEVVIGKSKCGSALPLSSHQSSTPFHALQCR